MPQASNVENVKPGLARAWFDTALNPLIRGLRTEVETLKHSNLTWRMHGERFANLLPTRDHINFEAWDNFEQFLAFYPELPEQVRKHDGDLEFLRQQVLAFSKALAAYPGLVEMLKTDTRLCAEVMGNRALELPRYVAEYVVNGLETLPDYNSIAWFWNENASRFLELRQRAELLPYWDAVRRAQGEFSGAAEILLDAVVAIRSEISLGLGIPFVEKVES